MPERITSENMLVYVQEHERRINDNDGRINHLLDRGEEYASKVDFKLLYDKVDKMNERLLVFSFSVAGSAMVFALTIMAATGRIHHP